MIRSPAHHGPNHRALSGVAVDKAKNRRAAADVLKRRAAVAMGTRQALAFIDEQGTLDGFKGSRSVIGVLRNRLHLEGLVADDQQPGELILTSSGRRILKAFRAAGNR
jgi:hypothetical protein